MIETPTSLQRMSAWWTRIRQSAPVRYAMADYREYHPDCEYCGGFRRLAVHHILPVHVCPDRAGDPTNLCTLCFRCHLSVGHLNDFTKRYVANLRAVIAAKRAGITQPTIEVDTGRYSAPVDRRAP